MRSSIGDSRMGGNSTVAAEVFGTDGTTPVPNPYPDELAAAGDARSLGNCFQRN